MERFKRLFSSKRQPAKVSKAIRCTQMMWDAVEKLAKDEGESANAYIVVALDHHLQEMVKQGKLEVPALDEDDKAAVS